jgi:hypothetical protein
MTHARRVDVWYLGQLSKQRQNCPEEQLSACWNDARDGTTHHLRPRRFQRGCFDMWQEERERPIQRIL